MPARVNILVLSLLLAIILINTSIVKAQEAPSSPPDVGSSQVLKASGGGAFKEGWNFFTVGFDGCTVKNVLDELQANGGSALNVANLFVKDNTWQPYSFLSSNAKDKKIANDQLLAFNSNQNFFLSISQNNCLNPDSQRQTQIEDLRDGGATKQSVMSKISELPFDLWSKLTNLVNSAPVSQNAGSNSQNTFTTLTVGGKTTVNDLGITGKVTAGLLTINGFNDVFASLNTLSGDLYLQDQGLGGVNVLNGKFTIDKAGNVKVLKLNVDDSNSSSSSIGGGRIPSGAAFVDIPTTAVTLKSRIFITATSETGGKALIVKTKTAGTGFRVIIENSFSSDITFDWFIIN